MILQSSKLILKFYVFSDLEDNLDDPEDDENVEDVPAQGEASENEEFLSALKKAQDMAASLKNKKSENKKTKRKHTDDNDEEEDDIVKKYGLDDYDNEDLRKFNMFHPSHTRCSVLLSHIFQATPADLTLTFCRCM